MRRTTLGAATTVLSAAMLAWAGPAAAATPLTDRVLTPAQLPGYEVIVEPTKVPRTTKSGKCSLVDPVGAKSVITALGKSVESARLVQITSVTAQVIEMPSATVAGTYFTKLKAKARTCNRALGNALEAENSELELRARVLTAPPVLGATRAFAVEVDGEGEIEGGKDQASIDIRTRQVAYLAGEHIVLISPSRTTTVATSGSVQSKTVDNAFTRQLGKTAARKAIGLLKAPVA